MTRRILCTSLQDVELPPSEDHTLIGISLGALSGNGSLLNPAHTARTKELVSCLRSLGMLATELSHETRIGGALRPSRAMPAAPVDPVVAQLAEALTPSATIGGDDAWSTVTRVLAVVRTGSARWIPVSRDASQSAPLAALRQQGDAHGLRWRWSDAGVDLEASQTVRQRPLRVPPDAHALAMIMVAAILTGSRMSLSRWPEDPDEAHRAVLELPGPFGFGAKSSHNRGILAGLRRPASGPIEASSFVAPYVFVLAACQPLETQIRSTTSIENGVVRALETMGARIAPTPDGWLVKGIIPKGISLQDYYSPTCAGPLLALATASREPASIPDLLSGDGERLLRTLVAAGATVEQ